MCADPLQGFNALITNSASAAAKQPALLIRDFSHVKRFWDAKLNAFVAKILPGEFYVSLQSDWITTVLGSCVSACIRDVNKGIGGMNHFMLPMQNAHSNHWGAQELNDSARYGNWAMEHLINELIKHGARKENFEIKLVGGGKVLQNLTNIGERNIDFVKNYLQEEGLRIAAEDLGGIYPRKVMYSPESGRLRVKRLRNRAKERIERIEERYSKSIQQQSMDSDIELF